MPNAAGIAIFCRATGRVLMVQRSGAGDYAGHWCFPGGRIEDGETPMQAAEREALEECGAVPYGALTVWHEGDYVTFRADCATETCVTLDGENTAWGWFAPDKPPLPVHPGVAVVLGLADEPEPPVYVPEYPGLDELRAMVEKLAG